MVSCVIVGLCQFQRSPKSDTTSQMPSLADHDLSTLEQHLLDAGHKPIHATKMLRQFYDSHGHLDPTAIPISRDLSRHISEHLVSRPSKILRQSVAADGTTKLLIGFESGGTVESVLMLGYRPTVAAGCVSSQIGCAMGCDFCATTRNGLQRDLNAAEIVEQFLHLKERAASIGRRLKTIVFMGMGEPLLNFDAVVAAVRRIADPQLGGLGWRHVTISTVGIVPAIDRLAKLDLNVHLAVSLHAPDDATRSRLVPVNRRYPVAEVLAAARRFESATNRIPTIEYCMLAGINDSDAQAAHLADLLQNFRAHINLIPYNSIGLALSGATYQRPSQDRLLSFIKILRDHNIVAHFRHTRGDDVNAACGQLRETALQQIS
jgi:23S rRNA (adenine2503-C2)-methyltransferase